MDFKASIFKSTYYPSASLLQQWLNWEFSYYIEETISEAILTQIKIQHKNILNKMVVRLKGLIVESDKKYNLGK